MPSLPDQWTVRTRESTGLVGPYAEPFKFYPLSGPSSPDPTVVTVGTTTSKTIDISWTPTGVPNSTYEVQVNRYEVGGTELFTTVDSGLTGTTYTIDRYSVFMNALVGSRKYYIRVRAVVGGIAQAWSPVVSALTMYDGTLTGWASESATLPSHKSYAPPLVSEFVNGIVTFSISPHDPRVLGAHHGEYGFLGAVELHHPIVAMYAFQYIDGLLGVAMLTWDGSLGDTSFVFFEDGFLATQDIEELPVVDPDLFAVVSSTTSNGTIQISNSETLVAAQAVIEQQFLYAQGNLWNRSTGHFSGIPGAAFSYGMWHYLVYQNGLDLCLGGLRNDRQTGFLGKVLVEGAFNDLYGNYPYKIANAVPVSPGVFRVAYVRGDGETLRTVDITPGTSAATSSATSPVLVRSSGGLVPAFVNGAVQASLRCVGNMSVVTVLEVDGSLRVMNSAFGTGDAALLPAGSNKRAHLSPEAPFLVSIEGNPVAFPQPLEVPEPSVEVIDVGEVVFSWTTEEGEGFRSLNFFLHVRSENDDIDVEFLVSNQVGPQTFPLDGLDPAHGEHYAELIAVGVHGDILSSAPITFDPTPSEPPPPLGQELGWGAMHI